MLVEIKKKVKKKCGYDSIVDNTKLLINVSEKNLYQKNIHRSQTKLTEKQEQIL